LHQTLLFALLWQAMIGSLVGDAAVVAALTARHVIRRGRAADGGAQQPSAGRAQPDGQTPLPPGVRLEQLPDGRIVLVPEAQSPAALGYWTGDVEPGARGAAGRRDQAAPCSGHDDAAAAAFTGEASADAASCGDQNEPEAAIHRPGLELPPGMQLRMLSDGRVVVAPGPKPAPPGAHSVWERAGNGNDADESGGRFGPHSAGRPKPRHGRPDARSGRQADGQPRGAQWTARAEGWGGKRHGGTEGGGAEGEGRMWQVDNQSFGFEGADEETTEEGPAAPWRSRLKRMSVAMVANVRRKSLRLASYFSRRSPPSEADAPSVCLGGDAEGGAPGAGRRTRRRTDRPRGRDADADAEPNGDDGSDGGICLSEQEELEDERRTAEPSDQEVGWPRELNGP
jgi:hypothetical protein